MPACRRSRSPRAEAAGCPIGLSFIGWQGGDEALLDLAVRLEPVLRKTCLSSLPCSGGCRCSTPSSFPYGAGFRSLTRETPEPVRAHRPGALPPWLAGALLRTGPSKFEVGRSHLQSLVRRAGDAAPLRLSRRPRHLCQPLPREQSLQRGRETGKITLCRIRHRSLPHACSAASPRSSIPSSPTIATSMSSAYGGETVAFTETTMPHAVCARRRSQTLGVFGYDADADAAKSRSRTPITMPPARAITTTWSSSA